MLCIKERSKERLQVFNLRGGALIAETSVHILLDTFLVEAIRLVLPLLDEVGDSLEILSEEATN